MLGLLESKIKFRDWYRDGITWLAPVLLVWLPPLPPLPGSLGPELCWATLSRGIMRNLGDSSLDILSLLLWLWLKYGFSLNFLVKAFFLMSLSSLCVEPLPLLPLALPLGLVLPLNWCFALFLWLSVKLALLSWLECMPFVRSWVDPESRGGGGALYLALWILAATPLLALLFLVAMNSFLLLLSS